MTTKLWDVYRDGQWWNAPDDRMFIAYYMTLRQHYGYTASEAFAKAKENAPKLGIGQPGGFIGLLQRELKVQP